MKSIDDLSHNLVEEILSRVPMISLGAVRSTCKLWYVLSKDPMFKLRGKAAKENMAIMMYDYKACLVSVNLHNHKDLVDPLMKQIGELKHFKVSDLFHCNGLLLCVSYERDNSRLVVWNPFTGQTKRIRPRSDHPYVYGMGYDSNNHHKILTDFYRRGQIGYKIYDLKSNSWSILDVTTEWDVFGQSVSLKGNSYFISQERVVAGEETLKKKCLLCFDFTRERFCGLPLPRHSPMEDSVILSLVREEKLALLYRRKDALEMKIWITNKIDEPNAVSWSYYLKLDEIPSNTFENALGSFLFDEKKKVAVIFDAGRTMRGKYRACMVGEGGHYREVEYGEAKYHRVKCSSYVPSSMQIQ